MILSSKYYEAQVELLIKVLPIINQFECFALKGGTAINLFFQNMSRLSVDIDLQYLPIEDRVTSFARINNALQQIVMKIQNKGDIKARVNVDENGIGKIQVSNTSAQIIIEPNYIVRGTVYPPINKGLCPIAVDKFGYEYDIRVVSYPDLYAGKICAALDRKHPRDLFDISLVINRHEFITKELLDALIIYLVSTKRPIHELLNKKSNLVNFEYAYNNQFAGMTNIVISANQLKNVAQQLISIVHDSLTSAHKQFLISITNGIPEWELLDVAHANVLPAILWKLENINNLAKNNPQKHKIMVNELVEVLQ